MNRDKQSFIRRVERLALRTAEGADSQRCLEVVATALIGALTGADSLLNPPFQEPYPIEFFEVFSRAYAGTVVRYEKQAAAPGCFYTPSWVADHLVNLFDGVVNSAKLVLDPACGAGALLLAWYEKHPESRLLGWDLDPQALRLIEAIFDRYTRDRARPNPLTTFQRDLFEDDAVGSSPADMEGEAPQISSVDLVLMNPPFGAVVSGVAQELALRSILCGREPDLSVLSLERVLELTRGSALGVILPDVIRMQSEYSKLRRVISESGHLKKLLQLPFGSFPRATVQPCLALIDQRGDQRPQEIEITSQNGSKRQLPLVELADDPDWCWDFRSERESDLWDHCSRGAVSLGEVVHSHEGVHTGNIRHKLFTTDGGLSDARPMLKGADVRRFAFSFRDRYLRYDTRHIDRSAGEYASLRDPEIFLGPKILSRQTTDRLIVCIDRTDSVTDNTLHSIKVRSRSKIELDWLAILLNSALATVLYRILSGERDRPLPQIKLSILRRLPIRAPRLSSELVGELCRRAELEAMEHGPNAETIADINRIVFDSYDISGSDRNWILES